MTTLLTNCIFCKIIRGEIPSFKLIETEFLYSFLDIGPLSNGHALIIPKYHGEKLTDVPDAYLTHVLPTAKTIINALADTTGVKDYNILQNNGRNAHQEVPHVHFHIIPKYANGEGLDLIWSVSEEAKKMDVLKDLHSKMTSRL